MIAQIFLLLFIFPLLVASVAEAMVVPGEEHCVINVASWDKLNIRNGPSTKARVVGEKQYGSCGIMVIRNCRSGWCPIEDGHIRGWTNSRFLSMVSPALYCTIHQSGHSLVKLRAFPSGQSRVLVALKRHSCGIAFLPYSRNNWQKVRVDGREGWVKRAEVGGQ